jgi:nitrogen fixation-related uncharacterized protein
MSNVTRIYLSVSCAQCCTCLSFCVLCPMFPVSIFLCLVSNVFRVYFFVSCVQFYLCTRVTLDTRHRKTETGDIRHKTQKKWTQVKLDTRNKKIDTENSVLCPMFPVSIFLCLVSNFTCVHFLCVLCLMLPVSIFLCLVSNVTRNWDTRNKKIDTENIGHKTQKYRHGKHWTQETER